MHHGRQGVHARHVWLLLPVLPVREVLCVVGLPTPGVFPALHGVPVMKTELAAEYAKAIEKLSGRPVSSATATIQGMQCEVLLDIAVQLESIAEALWELVDQGRASSRHDP